MLGFSAYVIFPFKALFRLASSLLLITSVPFLYILPVQTVLLQNMSPAPNSPYWGHLHISESHAYENEIPSGPRSRPTRPPTPSYRVAAGISPFAILQKIQFSSLISFSPVSQVFDSFLSFFSLPSSHKFVNGPSKNFLFHSY